jgi:hypothetical protein
MQTRSANAGFMDLNKASAAINAIPLVKESIPELMQLANGKVPGIPGYLALAKLQQIQQLVQDLGTKQPPQGTIKDNIEQSMSTMMTQQGQQQQAQQQQMPPGGIASLNRVPPNTPQPQMQPEAEPQQEAEQPVEAAHGGIMNAHVDPRMFNFDGGGIVSFAGGDFIGPQKEYPVNVDAEEARRLANNKRIAERLQDLKNATTPAQAAEAAKAAEAAGASRGMIYNAGKALGNLFRNAGTVLSEGLLSGPGAAAASRIAAPVGAAYTGYQIGREIDERTGIGKDIIDKSGIGSLIDSMYGQSGVKLTPEAQQRADAINENPPAPEPAPTSRPGQMTTANDPRTISANARPAPAPMAGPMAGGPVKPAAPTVPGGIVGPAASQTSDDAILALANKLTLSNPDAAQAKTDREAAIPADFDQAKAIRDKQEMNVALGIGTYGKNRRAQLDQMKKEFEASQPTSMDRVLASLGAFSRPGARAGDASDASYKMIEAERAARFEFAKAQDAANDAIEKIDEAVRTGDAAAIMAAKAEATKAKQTALEKKAELSQKVADNTSAAQRTSISAAAQITDARNRDETMLKTARMNNISAEKVAGINFAAHKYTADKPDAGERALRAYIDEKNKNGEAAAEAFLNDTEKVRAAVMGYKYTGPDKGVQDEAKILAEIRARTDIIDRKLQNAKLPQAERDALMQQRRIIEKEIRSSPGFGGVQINDPFKK